ncbi:MAG: sulfite exporter TauE/SafE family protein [Gammaproteobacteria bacterium]|nr:MAG: sulfite exporter TauE/SafE family protein [Gammaproteobacteria bacterium]
MGLPQQVREDPLRLSIYILFYNLGRIASYSLAGGLIAVLGGWVMPESADTGIRVGQILAAVFTIFVAIYIAGWTPIMAPIEQLGGLIWRRIEPWARALLPVQRLPQAVLAGMLWGWLPCGMVYAALVLALASEQGGLGAATMLAFGLGTLPATWLLGAGAARARQWLHQQWVKRTLAALILVSGLVALWGAFQPEGGPHGDHTHHSAIHLTRLFSDLS